MIIEKFISIALASVIFVDSSVMGVPVRYETITPERLSIPIIQEDIIETTVVEEPIVKVDKIEELVEEVKTEIAEKTKEPEVIEKPVKNAITKPPVTIDTTQPVITNTTLTESEIDLIALVTMAEAEGESELGKRLVIDVILNRYDSKRFPNTINGVIYAKNAFECMWNGRVNRCRVRADIRQLVVEELSVRTNSNIHYFRTNHYHNFGKPVLSEGNHYFSTY